MLRTKDGDENSYKSSDAINNIDWSVLNEGTIQYETMLYYKGLIEMRKTFGVFSQVDAVVTATKLTNGALAVTFDNGNGGKALVVINPNATSLSYYLSDTWNLVATSEVAGSEILAAESGMISVDGVGVKIYVNDVLAGK